MKGIKNNNDQINERRRELTEDYIIEINNKLFALAKFLHLNIPDIKEIETNQEIFNKANGISSLNDIKPFDEKPKFGDIAKKAIVNEIISQERKDEIKAAAIKSAGITAEELSKSAVEVLEEIKKKETLGVAPPKVNWKREGLDKSEKEKILKSIRANPKSSVFSSEFEWNTKDFLTPFKYLESSKKYNGPFIASIVDDRKDLERYSMIKNLSEKISDIYFGKYLLLSVYDITASESNPEESKHIYIGLKYLGMAGRLEFDCIGSVDGKVGAEQRFNVKEYLDAMDILYDEDHDDFYSRP
jgi:hypothetical protein